MQYNQQIYVWKIVLQKFNIKNEKPNSNINITKISHLPFYMLCYLLESMMAQCKNALTIGKYLETTCGSEMRAWYDKIMTV